PGERSVQAARARARPRAADAGRQDGGAQSAAAARQADRGAPARAVGSLRADLRRRGQGLMRRARPVAAPGSPPRPRYPRLRAAWRMLAGAAPLAFGLSAHADASLPPGA